MDAEPVLALLAHALKTEGLEAILIGNMAAAVHGAPVTTTDVDFLFRKTPANLRKLKSLARRLEAVLLRPYYPASEMFRLQRDNDGLQVDFLGRMEGIRSYESLHSRAKEISFGSYSLLVAALEDIIRSKRAMARPRDRAVLDILEKTLHEAEKNRKGRTAQGK